MREHDAAPIVEADDPSRYLATRPRKLRAAIRRGQEELAKVDGRIELLPPRSLADRLDALTAIEVVGHRRGGHVLAGRHQNFLREALVRLDRRGLLDVWMASVRGEPAAYLVAGAGPHGTYLYTTGVRQDFANMSIGSVLFAAAISHSLSRGLHVNMGPGDTLFKRRFQTSHHRLADILMLPRRLFMVTAPILRVLPPTTRAGKWT